MEVKYTEVTPIVPNTTMQKMTADGVDKQYVITPIDGYELHNSSRDWEEENPETGEKTFVRGYTRSYSTVGIDYDFDNTKEVDGHIAYGEKEIFAREIQSTMSQVNEEE